MPIPFWPKTRLGWVAALSFDLFVVLYFINGYMLKISAVATWWIESVLPYYGVALMVTVVTSSVGSVIAVLLGRDQAWAVRIATVPIFVWVGVQSLIVVLNALHL